MAKVLVHQAAGCGSEAPNSLFFGRSRNIWLRNVTAWVNTASLDLRLRTLSASSSSILGD